MVEAGNNAEARFAAIGMQPDTIKNRLKNKKKTESLIEVLDLGQVSECPKEKGALLIALADKFKPNHQKYKQAFATQIVEGKWTKTAQLEEGVKFLDAKLASVGKDYELDLAEMDVETGVGVVVTEEQIQAAVDALFTEEAAAIEEQKHDFNFGLLLTKVAKSLKWADGGMVRDKVNAKRTALLGEPPASDGKRKKAGKKGKKPEAAAAAASAATEETKEEENEIDITKLIGRDVDIGNSAEILAAHRAFTQGKVHTRFPPEPNGYLHIGHAKAIRFNFKVAETYGGNTYLRFDDTNPCKENNEFIDHIKEIVSWLGYTPFKTTASSDYFQQLYEHAVELIRREKAYVCFQSAEEMSRCRNEKIDSPQRNANVEDNLRNFEKMRTGRFAEGECSLRMKMNMQHDNPCMRDSVAYRIRYVGHPHSGDKWCIYPTYDYTHCLVDSYENITHSLCTLEFEIRRESYYQLLKDLDVYQPYVWEYSRMNISNTVLSKRKIEKLIDTGRVNGWDDPRLHTIQGLRRRGYTPSIINKFCEKIGVARSGNENITDYKLLEFCAREELNANAPRAFAVLDPIEIEITNYDVVTEREVEQPIFPSDLSKGANRLKVTRNIYVDRSDFSSEVKKGFYGIMPGQPVMLRYGPKVMLEQVVTNASGEVEKVLVKAVPEYAEKIKGILHWVSKDHSVPARVNQYSQLLTVENVANTAKKEGKDWLEYFNKESLVVYENARLWNMQAGAKEFDRFQFERVGYFCVDKDSKTEAAGGRLAFNGIVALREASALKDNSNKQPPAKKGKK